MPSRQFPGFVTAEMKRTVEVDLPSEHFKPSGKFATARDGEYGVLQAAIGIRAPTADGKGQLVFFFHDHVFIGWDADQEALSVFRIEEAGVGAFKVTYANQAAGDGAIGASLPPAVIIYTWNGRRFVSDKTPPPGVYGLNDPTANAIHVKLTG